MNPNDLEKVFLYDDAGNPLYTVDFLVNHQNFIPKIAELRFAEFSYLVPGNTVNDSVNRLREQCNDRILPICYVALKGEEYIGSFALRQYDLDTHNHLTPWLGGVFVPPEKRHQGIGVMLVKEGENKAREMGYSVLYLFTPSKAAWYEKRGWSQLEQASYNGFPMTVMQKYL